MNGTKHDGEIIGSRIDVEFPHDPIEAIPKAEAVRQIAILIQPRRTK